MPALVELTLDPEPLSARTARRAVEDALRGQGASDELIEITALLVSEVVTNAVVHARTIVRFQCEGGRLGVRVEVTDGSSVVPSTRAYAEHDSTGRGLVLVEMLASDSGVRMLPVGKMVWFVVGDYVGPRPCADLAARPPRSPVRERSS